MLFLCGAHVVAIDHNASIKKWQAYTLGLTQINRANGIIEHANTELNDLSNAYPLCLNVSNIHL